MKIKHYFFLIIVLLCMSCAGTPNKGDIYLDLSIPYANYFHVLPENEEVKNRFGFLGIGAGLDYYHSENQFLNVRGDALIDFPFPVPVSLNVGGESEHMTSITASLSNNHRIRRFTIGYGLSYARNTWQHRIYEDEPIHPPVKESISKTHDTLGLIFPVYFRVNNIFNIGVVYHPTFFRPNMTDKFSYEHLMSIDFAFKIPIYRKRNFTTKFHGG